MKIYLVGGAVRDELLEIESNDKDYVVVESTPEKMLSMGFSQVGKDFPVFLHPETSEEYALARTERKSGNKHTDFLFDWNSDITLEEDLLRRDLTINAMAKDSEGKLIDPFNGQEDLKERILRHVSENFKDDPLRVLRVARFAAKHSDFKVAPETMDLMIEMVKNGELNHLTPERIWKEIEKALIADAPENFISILKKTGALDIILPEIAGMDGVPQRADYHAEGDVFIHNQMVLREAVNLTKDLTNDEKSKIRFAALLHDVGKVYTPNELLYNEDGTIRGNHYGHDDNVLVTKIIDSISERLKVPVRYRKIAIDVASHHQRIHGIAQMKPNKIAKMFNDLNIKQKADINGEEYYLNMILLACKADAFGRKVTIENRIEDAPRKYPQEEIARKSFKAYMDIGSNLQDWIKKYEERNEKKPEGELIKERVHEFRASSIKKVLKN